MTATAATTTTVLHVIDAQADPAALFALRCLLEKLPPAAFRQRLIALDARAAARHRHWVGRDCDAVSSGARLARRLRAGRLRFDWLGGLDLRSFADEAPLIVHAWGAGALDACRAIDAACVLHLHGVVAPADARRLSHLLTPATAVVVGSQIARRRLGEHGINPAQAAVIRSPVDFRAIADARRAGLRAALAPPEDGPILLTTGPAAREGGQFHFAWGAAIVQQLMPRARVILPFDSAESDRARRLLRDLHADNMLLTPPADWNWPQLVAVADLFVDPAERDGPTEPLAWAMAGGVPIVGAAIHSVTELIADRHNGLLVRHPRPRGLAATMLRLIEDRDLCRKLADTARGQAYEVFSVREFADNVAALYENVLTGRTDHGNIRDTAMVQ